MSTQEKRYTVSEFEAYAERYSHRRFELVNGEIVEKMPTQLHSFIIAVLTQFFMNYFDHNPIAWILPEARFQLPGDKANARVPDLAFVLRKDRTLISKGAAPYMPDLAIEVQSPDQNKADLRDKARYYLDNGSRIVWLFYPEEKTVEIMTPDRQIVALTASDTLTLEDMAPGLSIPLSKVFPLPTI